MNKTNRITLSLGSNVEPRGKYLADALDRLSKLPSTRLVAASRVIETDPVDVPEQFAALKFLNQVAIFETALSADDFSNRMHSLEDELGRVRTVRNGPRTIDLDLILFGDLVSDRPELTLPHPRAAEREFVMAPLRELWLDEFHKLYDGYVAGYRDASGALPEMMQLKYAHTKMVVRNAELIAEGEAFTDEERFASVSAALFHDTGRYEQLRRYNTFKDSESVDHAVFSHEILVGQHWLDATLGAWPVGKRLVEAIAAAVLYHNRRDIPDGLDPLTFTASHAVRDADKLDIFRVLEKLVSTSDWRHDRRAFWNLETDRAPNPAVVAAIRERRPVDYQNIKSLADFVLIQIGWMVSGLQFATSRRLCAERGHLEFRRKFLREIGGGQSADELCDLAASSIFTSPARPLSESLRL